MNVQAFLNNISFPKTLDELEYFAERFNVEEILNVKETEWTAPKWAVKGDIVFFFHAKTAIQKITMLETKLKQEKGNDWRKTPGHFGRHCSVPENFIKCTEEKYLQSGRFQTGPFMMFRKETRSFIGQVDFMHPLIGFMCFLVPLTFQSFQILYLFPARVQSRRSLEMILSG